MNSKTKTLLSIVLVVLLLVMMFSVIYIINNSNGNAAVQDGRLVKYDAENHTALENLVFGLQTAGVGMGIVFAVLIILWGVIALIPKIIGNNGNKPTEKKPVEAAAAPAVSEASAQDDEQLITAICTCAIAASRGESDCAFKVISITKIQ